MRIIYYSVQDNHLHLLVEVDCTDRAAAKRAVIKAMQGLGVRLARRLNKVLGRRGRLIEERYPRDPADHAAAGQQRAALHPQQRP